MADRLTRHWKNRDNRRPRRKGFEVQEELGAAAHPGGEPTRGSGCSRRPAQKGDSVGDIFRQSDKTTEKGSLSIKRDWLEEIALQAQATGHQPMLMIGFDQTAKHPRREDWIAFPRRVASYMTHIVDALQRGDIEEAKSLAELVGRAT